MNSNNRWTLIRLHEFTKDDNALELWLQEKGLLNEGKEGPRCKNLMKRDGSNWRCRRQSLINKRKVTCDVKIAICKESWFSNSKLPKGKILMMTYMLIHNYEQQVISHELEISKPTVSQWAHHLRQILTEWALQSTEVIGGEGKVIEIDESKFGKRKYHRGHQVEGQWVFGGVERGSGKLFLVPVEQRDATTLTQIIKQWILPGTTIISDYWKAYDRLGEEGYDHLKVNHSLNFVDPETGAHTNTIESTWRHAKYFLPQYRRTKGDYSAYLAHYMFVKKAQSEDKDVFAMFVDEVAKVRFDASDNDHDVQSGEESE